MTEYNPSRDAVVAAAKVIYADSISNHAGDNAPQIIDACERVAHNVLGAAGALIAELAWDEGRKHGARYPYGERGLGTDDNPYRNDAQ